MDAHPRTSSRGTMLNLRSFRDYPDVFHEDGDLAVLSDRELAVVERVEIRSRRHAWVLGRLCIKELVQRWYDERGLSVPGARQVSVLPGASGVPVVRVEGYPSEHGARRLAASVSYCDSFAFGALREHDAGHRFAVVMDRVEPTYPFFDDALLTEDEVARVRHEDVTTQDRVLTAFGALKKGVGKALGLTSASPARQIEVLSVGAGGEAVIRYDPDLFGGDTRPVVRGRAWFYETYVLAFVALWRDASAAPAGAARIEEELVLPDSRFDEWTR